MRLLVLDAALGPCGAAFFVDGACVAREWRPDRAGLAGLPAMARSVLARAGGLDAVAVTTGPGSFTGVRAALALAQGVALGAGVPVLGITVAEAMVEAAAPGGRVLWVALDTRRGRVFLAQGGATRVVGLDALPRPDGPVMVAGDAGRAVADALAAAGVDAVASPVDCVMMEAVGRVAERQLAAGGPLRAALPLYVEPPEARAAVARPAPA